MRIVIAPSGFKESLEPKEAADCIAEGILRVLPSAEIEKAPLVDGGEGFTRALVAATDGELVERMVTGPVGDPVKAHYGFLGGDGSAKKTAVLEMASAAGLSRVPRDVRDPCVTTTYGVGELIRAALDDGAARILLGCGDSGTNASPPIRQNGDALGDDHNGSEAAARMDLPTRVALHRMISDMREEVGKVGDNGNSEHASARLEEMAREVSRLADFSYPMDLELERTDVRALVYGVVQRFQRRMIERSVSLEVDVSPEIRFAVCDRLKLREAVSELLGNSLDAIPDRGGRIGLRVRADDEGHAPDLLIEVADDGAGADQSLIDRSFDREESSYSGLAMVRAVVNQHGGNLEIESEPGEGTYAQIRIPLRD